MIVKHPRAGPRRILHDRRIRHDHGPARGAADAGAGWGANNSLLPDCGK